ncbi:hypothetical protein GCM10009097_31130 [Pigmentiphaga daeguensis]|uniref:Uncharacterized protein n=1 Tax=Pigmentiphaga daeguensis TaxID=414049 RepID=A0ABN1C4Z2_9BURK
MAQVSLDRFRQIGNSKDATLARPRYPPQMRQMTALFRQNLYFDGFGEANKPWKKPSPARTRFAGRRERPGKAVSGAIPRPWKQRIGTRGPGTARPQARLFCC